uniref:CUB domain-containing protein n=1 Tax=Loa loa TaxID=7209 RepID=A0A1I7V7Y7_LOALO
MSCSWLPIHFITSFIFITNAVCNGKVNGVGTNHLDPCKCRSANFGVDVLAGELKSPGYPINYCNNLNCKYEIDAVPGQSIHLSIVSFETELRHDLLEIHQTFIFANNQYSARIAIGEDCVYCCFFLPYSLFP